VTSSPQDAPSPVDGPASRPSLEPGPGRRTLARTGKALAALLGLAGLQFAGDAIVAWSGWPVPGSLVGLVLLLALLQAHGRVPAALDDAATPLLRHLMLLLIPSVAAVGMHAGALREHAAAFVLVSTVVTALTLAATAWVMQRLMRRAGR